VGKPIAVVPDVQDLLAKMLAKSPPASAHAPAGAGGRRRQAHRPFSCVAKGSARRSRVKHVPGARADGRHGSSDYNGPRRFSATQPQLYSYEGHL